MEQCSAAKPAAEFAVNYYYHKNNRLIEIDKMEKFFGVVGAFLLLGGMTVGLMAVASISFVEKLKVLEARGQLTSGAVVGKYRRATQTMAERKENRNIAVADYEYHIDFVFKTASGDSIQGTSFSYGFEKWDALKTGDLVPVIYDPMDHSNYRLESADVKLGQEASNSMKSTSIGLLVVGAICMLVGMGFTWYNGKPGEAIASDWVQTTGKVFGVEQAENLVDLVTRRRLVTFYVEYPLDHTETKYNPNNKQYVDKAIADQFLKGQLIDVLHPPGAVERAQLNPSSNE